MSQYKGQTPKKEAAVTLRVFDVVDDEIRQPNGVERSAEGRREASPPRSVGGFSENKNDSPNPRREVTRDASPLSREKSLRDTSPLSREKSLRDVPERGVMRETSIPLIREKSAFLQKESSIPLLFATVSEDEVEATGSWSEVDTMKGSPSPGRAERVAADMSTRAAKNAQGQGSTTSDGMVVYAGADPQEYEEFETGTVHCKSPTA